VYPLLALLQVSVFAALLGWAASLRGERGRLARVAQVGAGPVEREAHALIEAQRTAQLGSYAIDLASEELACSDELRRLLGLGPDAQIESGAALLAWVHPEDRDALLGAWEAAKGSLDPVTVEHRIVRPDGATRWVDARVRVVSKDCDGLARLIGTMLDVSERRAVESALAHQALHDSLTGLPNRAWFLGRLAQAMTHRQVRPSGLAVLFLDIDRFKWLNDSRGHAAGDELLVKVGRRLRATMRPGDTVARFGGDEFVVLCEDVPTEEDARLVAERLASVLRRPVDVAGQDTAITVSIGVAFLAADDHSVTSEALVRDADAAMYEAKEAGRDRHEIFDATTRLAATTRHETVQAMRRGLELGEFVVHYQPRLDVVTQRPVGVEALVRWDRPERGLLPPDAFLPLAEESGLSIAIGAAALRTACRHVGSWGGCGRTRSPLRELTVAVHLGRRQLLDPNLCDVVEAALVDGGVLPWQLSLEIAEGVLRHDPEATTRVLGRLRRMGIRVAVDDFGTGFSSLTSLKQLPVDVLKVDPTFVRGLTHGREDRAIVASVVDLAHAFGLTAVAEGVETVEQLDELRGIGCEHAEGPLWSPALSADGAERWLAQHAGSELRAHATSRDLRSVPVPSTIEPGHRVLVVDDDRTYRQMLRILVETEPGYRVVGEAADGREAIALARSLIPDVILLDLSMPGMGGLEALPLLLAVVPTARVVVLSSLEPAYLMEVAGGQGAAAFCTKVDAPDTLLHTLEQSIAA